MDESGEFLISLGFAGLFAAGSEIQSLISKQLHTIEQTTSKIWPKEDEGLELLESFQKEGTLRDLRDLSVLSPPNQPRRFHNFNIFQWEDTRWFRRIANHRNGHSFYFRMNERLLHLIGTWRVEFNLFSSPFSWASLGWHPIAFVNGGTYQRKLKPR